jgi:hypothetical protein
MGTARFVKHPGKENFINVDVSAADRAFPLPAPGAPKAIGAARNVHQPALA